MEGWWQFSPPTKRPSSHLISPFRAAITSLLFAHAICLAPSTARSGLLEPEVLSLHLRHGQRGLWGQS
jgi:hypothetical protein